MFWKCIPIGRVRANDADSIDHSTDEDFDRYIADLAEHALRCLKLADPTPFVPRTMREWLT